MKEQNKMIQWIKAHKKLLILTGISIVSLIALVLGIKNEEYLKELWEALKRTVEPKSQKSDNTVIINVSQIPVPDPETITSIDFASPIEVRRHIRNLHDGWRASPDKIATALKYNIILKEGQTWVDSYLKGECIA